MKYIDVDGTQVAVTKRFKSIYLEAKSAKRNALKRLNELKKMPNLKSKERGIFARMRKARAQKKLNEAQTKYDIKDLEAVFLYETLKKLEKEANETPTLQKAKIKYPSLENPVDTVLEKKRRKRKLVLTVLGTALLVTTALVLTGGFAAPAIAGLAIAAPLISGLAVPASAITGLVVAGITGIGAAIFGRTYHGLRKYKKIALEVKKEQKDIAIKRQTAKKRQIAERKKRIKNKNDWKNYTPKNNSKKSRKGIDPPGLTPDSFNAYYSKTMDEVAYSRTSTEKLSKIGELKKQKPDNFFAQNSSAATPKVRNTEEDIELPGFVSQEKYIPEYLTPAWNPEYLSKKNEKTQKTSSAGKDIFFTPDNPSLGQSDPEKPVFTSRKKYTQARPKNTEEDVIIEGLPNIENFKIEELNIHENPDNQSVVFGLSEATNAEEKREIAPNPEAEKKLTNTAQHLADEAGDTSVETNLYTRSIDNDHDYEIKTLGSSDSDYGKKPAPSAPPLNDEIVTYSPKDKSKPHEIELDSVVRPRAVLPNTDNLTPDQLEEFSTTQLGMPEYFKQYPSDGVTPHKKRRTRKGSVPSI